jgi:hypothetical protein
MAGPAHSRIFGGPFDEPGVGLFPRSGRVTALVAGDAPVLKVGIGIEDAFIYQKTLVQFFRPDRGRGASSPLAFGIREDWWNIEFLHDRVVGMAAYAGRIPRKDRGRKPAQAENPRRDQELLSNFHTASSI